jgi:hypothetical protein
VCSGGISSVLVPGAGEPNFDSFVANPYQSKKERQEQEVALLLDKLQPDTIMLDPEAIGKVLAIVSACVYHAQVLLTCLEQGNGFESLFLQSNVSC